MSHLQGTEVILETYSVFRFCTVKCFKTNKHKHLLWGLAQKPHLSPTNKSESMSKHMTNTRRQIKDMHE